MTLPPMVLILFFFNRYFIILVQRFLLVFNFFESPISGECTNNKN